MILALRQPEFLMDEGVMLKIVLNTVEELDQTLYNKITDRFQVLFEYCFQDWVTAEGDLSWFLDTAEYQFYLAELLVMAAECQELVDDSSLFAYMSSVKRHIEASTSKESSVLLLPRVMGNRLAELIIAYSEDPETGNAAVARHSGGRLVKNAVSPKSLGKASGGTKASPKSPVSPHKRKNRNASEWSPQVQALTDLKRVIHAWFLMDTSQVSVLYPFYQALSGLTDKSDPGISSQRLASVHMRLRLVDS